MAELTGFGLSSKPAGFAAEPRTPSPALQSVLSNPLEHATGMFYSSTININIKNKLKYIMAELTGFEPATSCVTGTCPKPLDDSSA